jgi:hypothetical protein
MEPKDDILTLREEACRWGRDLKNTVIDQEEAK